MDTFLPAHPQPLSPSAPCREATIVDTHCHLDDPVFRDSLEAVVGENVRNGVRWMLAAGTTRASSRMAVEIARKFPSVFAAVGIQPTCVLDEIREIGGDDDYSLDIQEKLLREIEELSRGEKKVVALGETGLDDYWKNVPMPIQVEFLKGHLALGRKLDLPVIIHCRDSEMEILRVAEAEFAENGLIRGVIHSFSSDRFFLEKCLELGLSISYSGSVTYKNKKYDALRATVPHVPAGRLLIETDSPYLIPTQARKTLKVNQPWAARYTAEVLAEMRGVAVEEILRQTAENAESLFRVSVP